MRSRTDDLRPPELKLLDDIEQYGVHLVHVPEEGQQPNFSFTVGMWHSFEQPEVIVFGLPEEVAHELLDALADEASDGRKFLPGEKHDDLLVGYPVRFLDVPRERRGTFFGSAEWAYDGEQFPCVQLVWPDKQGRWPWSAEVRDGFRESQPVIGRREDPV